MAFYKDHNITIDIKRTPRIALKNIVAGETGNRLIISLTNDDAAVPMSSATHRVCLRIESKKGTRRQDSYVDGSGITFIDGSAYIILSTGAYTDGLNRCWLEIYTTRTVQYDTLACSAEFIFTAKASDLDEEIGEQYPSLIQAEIDARAAANEARTAAESIGAAIDFVRWRVSELLSLPGWYRVLSYNVGTDTGAKFATSAIIDFNIGSVYHITNNMAHFVRMIGIYNWVRFGDESSYGNTTTPLIDKIRYTYDSNNIGHVDVHYDVGSENTVFVDFDVKTDPTLKGLYTAESLQAVDDAPIGETIVESYDFVQNATSGIITTEISITTDSTGYYNVSAYPRDKYMILNVLPLLKSDYYAMPTGSNGTTGQWVIVKKADGTAAASESMTIRLAMIHI